MKTEEFSPVTVSSVLRLPTVQRAVPKVVCAHQMVDRPVRWVHAADVSDIADYLKGGELLLSTGGGLGQSKTQYSQFVAQLAERGVSALALQMGERFESVPYSLTVHAERCGLPIIALHRQVPFVEITEEVHRVIIDRQVALLRRADELHRLFSSLMLEGARSPEVLAELSRVIDNPVVLEKTGHGIISQVAHRSDDETVIAAWQTKAKGIDGVPTLEADIPARGGEPWGRIVAVALASEIGEYDQIAVEQAANAVGLSLLRDREEEHAARRARGDFLSRLINAELDETNARTRAGELGVTRSQTLVPGVVTARSFVGTEASEQTSLIWRDIQRGLRDQRISAILGSQSLDRELLIVLSLTDAGERTRVLSRIAEDLRLASERYVGQPEAVMLSAGKAVSSWSAVGAELKWITRSAASIAGYPSEECWHDLSRPSLGRLMWSLKNNDDVRQFTRAQIEPLIEHDKRRKSKLLPTLEAYCSRGGRKADTARELYIERQSLYHRLERIEGLLNVDLSDTETVLSLYLALRVSHFTADL